MLRKIFRSTKLFILLPIIIALIYPDFAPSLKEFIVPILFLMMFIPFLRVKTPKFERANFKFASKMFFLNYIVYFIVAFLISFIVKDDLLRTGVLLIAFMPPAVAIMKWTYFTDGDMEKTLFSQFFLYVSALVITPLLMWFFFRESVDTLVVVKTLFTLIVLPFLLTRPLQNKLKWDFREVLNVVTGMGTYIVVGLNIDKVLAEFSSFIPLVVVFSVLIFGLGFSTYAYTRFKNIPKKEAIVYMLFSNSKNGNLGLGFALLLFEPLVALPFVIIALVRTVFNFVFIWLFQ